MKRTQKELFMDAIDGMKSVIPELVAMLIVGVLILAETKNPVTAFLVMMVMNWSVAQLGSYKVMSKSYREGARLRANVREAYKMLMVNMLDGTTSARKNLHKNSALTEAFLQAMEKRYQEVINGIKMVENGANEEEMLAYFEQNNIQG